MNYHYKKLQGENIYLSPLAMNDAEKFATWLNDFQITDYTGASAKVYSYEAETEWFAKNIKENPYIMAIIKMDNDEVIGNISLNNIDRVNRKATLGILIGEDKNRSKGYGTEAIGLILEFAFKYLNLNSVFLTYLECNTRARKCYEKVGFKEIGRRRKCEFVNGKYYDQIMMDILADEFTTEYIKNKNVK